jgi:hypothetical protein
MKLRFLFYSTFLLTVLSASNCKKNNASADELPPETQTGANTFGCLVNGQIFKPGGAQLSGGSLQCNYQYLGSGVNGGYYFVLTGRYRNNSNASGSSVGLFTDSLRIQENVKYILKNPVKGSSYAYYSYYTSAIPFQDYETDGNIYTGELWIKKLDTINQIVSGTFWFDAVNASGQKAEIREGRFDVHYTR